VELLGTKISEEETNLRFCSSGWAGKPNKKQIKQSEGKGSFDLVINVTYNISKHDNSVLL